MTTTAEPTTSDLTATPAPVPQRQKIPAVSNHGGGVPFWQGVINVTSAHIAAGIRCSSTSCPLALAARDAGISMTVGEDAISKLELPLLVIPGTGKKTVVEATLPPTREMRDFVRRFDAGLPVEPMTIKLWACT